ncbi:hypothetical protein [Rubellicoccus peritrichatus]|uniref:Phosphotyrosine protein phosphatase I domain-containing protein n=1 Tax=Rubellicoccus peritrichatus TaxID=3080537 RepID=A0AAQ3LAC5_9BACT|nr:hypothetical protein [Puniceicoccus sp. CR14]WOO41756.1 hypothetical protein RZN69_01550 [Puniceicoccus sp. CR14]
MEERHPEKILFVCSLNKFRSYTAEQIYRGFDQYQVRSRGTEKGARIKVTEGDIGWANIIFTMEKRHTERLRAKFSKKLKGKKIITLFIEDIYSPMDPSLIEVLKEKLRKHIGVPE